MCEIFRSVRLRTVYSLSTEDLVRRKQTAGNRRSSRLSIARAARA